VSYWRCIGLVQYGLAPAPPGRRSFIVHVRAAALSEGTFKFASFREGAQVGAGSQIEARFQRIGEAEVQWLWLFDRVDVRHGSLVRVPMWGPLMLVMVPSALWWYVDIREWRRRHGLLCRSCGYDRHGLAADAKCPECGTILTK
jgi:hypothetical protein